MKLSQEELGFEARLHRTYISQIECRERNVSVNAIEKLAKALKVRPGEIVAIISTDPSVTVSPSEIEVPDGADQPAKLPERVALSVVESLVLAQQRDKVALAERDVVLAILVLGHGWVLVRMDDTSATGRENDG